MNNPPTLLVCRQSPYGSHLARSGLEIALAAAVYDRDISVLFMDEGVWQLKADQAPQAIDHKSIEKLLASFELYDLDTLYVENHSLEQRGLRADALAVPVSTVATGELPGFFERFECIISC